jgi:hypothetical protein
VLCCAVLCCAVLCCAVLCCAVLCCAVLCCAIRGVAMWMPTADLTWTDTYILTAFLMLAFQVVLAVSPTGFGSQTEAENAEMAWLAANSMSINFGKYSRPCDFSSL